MKIEIIDSNFTSNYAGLRGAAINLADVLDSQVIIRNSSFTEHTGAYSFLEEANENPFYKVLTMKKHKLNFYVHETR